MFKKLAKKKFRIKNMNYVQILKTWVFTEKVKSL